VESSPEQRRAGGKDVLKMWRKQARPKTKAGCEIERRHTRGFEDWLADYRDRLDRMCEMPGIRAADGAGQPEKHRSSCPHRE
jgi:hypothetical protein